MQQNPNILQVDKLSKYFGGLAAVSNCSLKIKKGSITGIIGPNGSGKTGLLWINNAQIIWVHVVPALYEVQTMMSPLLGVNWSHRLLSKIGSS